MASNDSQAYKNKDDPRFGVFGGVFTPCTLTILGMIMFLRLSDDAAVVFLGFKPPDAGKEMSFFDGMEHFAAPLKRVIFVYSTGEMALEA